LDFVLTVPFAVFEMLAESVLHTKPLLIRALRGVLVASAKVRT